MPFESEARFVGLGHPRLRLRARDCPREVRDGERIGREAARRAHDPRPARELEAHGFGGAPILDCDDRARVHGLRPHREATQRHRTRLEPPRHLSGKAKNRAVLQAPSQHRAVDRRRSKLDDFRRIASIAHDGRASVHREPLMGASHRCFNRSCVGERECQAVGRGTLVFVEVAVLRSAFVPTVALARNVDQGAGAPHRLEADLLDFVGARPERRRVYQGFLLHVQRVDERPRRAGPHPRG
jgi:hypothetical protein